MSKLVRTAGGLSLAFMLGGAVASPSHPPSFQQLLEDRRAVESVLWKHRIWPATNPDPKPDFSQTFPDELLSSRLRDDLARSAALSVIWNRPLSGRDLQAELDRMVAHSNDSALLREMFSALHNDPTRIAYALALPALADRRLRSWYAQDARFHESLRASAEETFSGGKATGATAAAGAEYLVLEYVRGKATDGKTAPAAERNATTPLSPEEWGQLVSRLADSFGVLPAGGKLGSEELLPRLPLHRASGFREEADRFVSTTLLERSADRIKVAATSWRKRPFESWWEETMVKLDPESGIPEPYSYILPEAASQACEFDTWQNIHASVPPPRAGSSMIWTGTEVIVWGGSGPSGYLNTGHRYHPATDTWTSTGVDGSTPTPRNNHTAIWTGSEMIVWGGLGPGSITLGTGGRYNPLTDSWSTLKTGPTSPTPRRGHSAVWTGSRMIVWGGTSTNSPSVSSYLNTGGLYNPSNDSWTATLADATTPQAREGHVAVWTGTQMIVWGGRVYWSNAPWQWRDVSTGGRYNPSNDTWTATGGSPPQARSRSTGIWTGSEFIVWGGYHVDMNQFGQMVTTYLNSGGRYTPSNDSWTATRLDGTTPPARVNHTAVWTGSEMIVWGGDYPSNGTQYLGTGMRYSPANDTWADVYYPGPQPRSQHGAVWTGSEMIVWGGTGYAGTLTTGGRYNPSSNSWIPTAVEPDYSGTAIWSGSEMIVWGTSSADSSGNPPPGLYSPATDSWRTGSDVAAPPGRPGHTAIWTGTEMIVWGGDHVSSGGRYNPTLDAWTPMRNDGTTPISRQSGFPAAVWTGTEMLLWGGFCTVTGPCAGGRYNPSSDTWTLMRADASAPEQRWGHTGIWTGQKMVIFGGENPYRLSQPYFIGDYALYDPALDQWTLSAAPDARSFHTAVWTGNEMLVWGGRIPSGPSYVYTNTGWRFDSAANSFAPISTDPATPSAREGHSAVWTGNEMIIWGGNSAGLRNDGSRYAPGTDSWSLTKLDATTPSPRLSHLAVWGGNEMLIWWGQGPNGAINNGGRYCSCAAPITYYQDLDGDGWGNPSTGVPFCGAPSGAWASVGGDCNDQDAGDWSIPGEARDLGFSDDVTMTWLAPELPGSSLLSYDLIRSSNPADFVASGVCVVSNTSSPSATDASSPPSGAALYYLVRAKDACPGGSGPLGTDSQGNPRSALNCP